MATRNMIRQGIDKAGLMLVLLGLGAGSGAGVSSSLTPKVQPGGTRTLSFPSGQCTGNLYLEPESGPGWGPRDVRPKGEWEYLSAAQGNVRVPEDRNIKLWIRLALSQRESTQMRRQNPQAFQLTIADRTRKDPDDLAGLSKLDPNDLFWLSVGTEMHRRTGAAPRIFEPISDLTGLRMLTLFNSGITDEGLKHLRPLRSLTGLELMQVSIGNRGLAILRDLPALEYLQLGTGVTDAGLAQIAQVSSLRWLNIVDGKMWGPGLAKLAHLPRLERLCLWGASSISDRHVKYLEGLTQLRGLTFNGANTLTDASLASIGKLANLEELHFIRSRPKFTPAGVAHLKELRHLNKVDFAQAWPRYARDDHGDEVVRQLAASVPNLESIQGIYGLTAEGMQTLARFRNLKCLHVALKNKTLGYYGPTGVSHLAGLDLLEELHVFNAESFSGADFAPLEPLGNLKKLLVGSQHLTDRSLASIGKLDQLESLSLSVLQGSGVSKSGLNHLNGLPNLQYLQVNAWGNGNRADPGDELMLDLSALEKIKDLSLSLPLRDGDLAFLRHLPSLETLMISPDPNSVLTGASLCHLGKLVKLNRLGVFRLSRCTGADLAYLNELPKLRSLRVSGDITDTALASLTGPLSLESLRVETDNPIRKETVDDLTGSHPMMEFIHIHNLTQLQTRPASVPRRPSVHRPVPTNRRSRR